MKKPRRPEDILTDEVRVSPIARAEGVLMMRNNSAQGVRVGSDHPELFGLGEGSADLILCVRGRFVGLELKVKKGKQREKQEDWERKVQMARGEYILAKTVEEANTLVDRVNQQACLEALLVSAARAWAEHASILGQQSKAGMWREETLRIAMMFPRDWPQS